MALAWANCVWPSGTLNLDVTEADGLGEGVDIGLRAGHEVPAIGGFRMAVALEVFAFLGRGQISALAGIDADHDHVEVLAGNEVDHLQGAGEAVHLLGAEHGAAVVDQGQNRRPLAEVAAQGDLPAGIVSEGEAERQLLVEALGNADPVEERGRLVVDGAHLLFA